MKIGLIDVDGHNFPNLALMKLSAWHKTQGDSVEWAQSFRRYDLLYKSKVFTFSTERTFLVAADRIVKGGTGYRDYSTALPDEIDPHAIRQTRHNFPDTVQLGDVERWREWAIDWAGIDLLLAGSPCQGFSFCGKQLAFDDPRSRLFFVFADILAHVRKANPNVRFLLENVNMRREYLRVISEYCGVFPVRINSALVSAQNRDRWYWTDIRTRQEGLFGELYSDIPQPADRGLTLRDVLDDKVPEKYNVSEKLLRYITDPKRLGKYTELNDGSRKTMCLNAGAFSSWTGSFVYQRPRGYNKGGIHTDKAPALSANAWEHNNILHEGEIIRRLTPTECARLQTIPAWYEWVVSDSQIYRMLGNGWTVEVIKHILSF